MRLKSKFKEKWIINYKMLEVFSHCFLIVVKHEDQASWRTLFYSLVVIVKTVKYLLKILEFLNS